MVEHYLEKLLTQIFNKNLPAGKTGKNQNLDVCQISVQQSVDLDAANKQKGFLFDLLQVVGSKTVKMNYSETNETVQRVAAIKQKILNSESMSNNKRRVLHCEIEYVLISIDLALTKLKQTGDC